MDSTSEVAPRFVTIGQGVNRREFLILGLSATGALMLAACSGGSRAPDVPINVDVGQALRQPHTLEAMHVNGDGALPRELRTTLRVHERMLTATRKGTPVEWNVRAFGYPDPDNPEQFVYSIPGPTIRMRRGDRFVMTLKNRLTNPSEACLEGSEAYDQEPNCFHGEDYTNFHFHGSHISPNPGADFVLLNLPPEQDFDYDFVWPEAQPPGTHWYHPHKHGSTALQVGNGMSGVIIIDGDFDTVPEIARAEDIVMVIQEIAQSLGFPNNTERLDLSVNGQIEPRVTMRVNEVQRWRLVGATMKSTGHINIGFADVVKPQVYEIAHDGVQFAPGNWRPDEPVAEVTLGPGNRIDLLAQAPSEPGMYLMNGTQVDPPGQNVEPDDPDSTKDRLIVVEVKPDDGSGYVKSLPAALPELPYFLEDIADDEIVRTRVLTFEQFGEPAGGRGDNSDKPPPQFGIDGKKFDGTRVDQVVVKGTAEEWTILNTTQIKHPFHIHINPFQIVAQSDVDGGAEVPANRIWQDTIPLPTGTVEEPGWVRIRHRFTDFTGTLVLHCHILGHEDRGMMQLVQIAESPEPIPIPASAFCAIPQGTPVLAQAPSVGATPDA